MPAPCGFSRIAISTDPDDEAGLLYPPCSMPPSYAVVWREEEDRLYAGKFELRSDRVRLEGTSSQGYFAIEQVFYDDLDGVRIARAPERLHGRPTLVVERRGGLPLSVTSADNPGMLHELLERLATLMAGRGAASRRVVAVLPLKDGARSDARTLLEEGPPFDPEATSLQRHQVYLTEHEVIFVFEGPAVAGVVEQLLGDPAVWRAASSWESCRAATPRIAEVAYSWVRD